MKTTNGSIVAISLAGAMFAPACEAARSQWDFVVRLDGRPIGMHRFVLDGDPAANATLASDAHFEVRVLGWTAYRYDHHARERWSRNCLAALDATTDDDGRVNSVRELPLPGCLMSFAYWNAQMRSQQRLLDPGTGRIVNVTITPLPGAVVDTDRGMVDARGWRIAGLPQPIDIWWSGDEWVALDTVAGGKRLTYRLR